MSDITNLKSLTNKLNGVVRSAKSQRDNIAACQDFAGDHFLKHGDTAYFGTIMDKLVPVKSINTALLLRHTCAKYGVTGQEVTNEKGQKVWAFKKNADRLESDAAECVWYEYQKPQDEKADFSLEQLKAYLKRKAEAKDGVSSEAMAGAALALQAIVAQQAAES